MSEQKQLIIQDSNNLKNIFVQLNLEKNTVTVMSNFSAWDNLAFLMEALAITAEKCVKEGIPREQVNQEIQNYLKKAMEASKIIR